MFLRQFFLTVSEKKAKIQSHSEDYIQGVVTKNKKLRKIRQSMNMVLETNKSVLESQQWLRFHISFI